MKHSQDSLISSVKSAAKKETNSPVLARKISRQLNKSEIAQVSGAGKGRKCWDTDNGGMFTKLDCAG